MRVALAIMTLCVTSCTSDPAPAKKGWWCGVITNEVVCTRRRDLSGENEGAQSVRLAQAWCPLPRNEALEFTGSCSSSELLCREQSKKSCIQVD